MLRKEARNRDKSQDFDPHRPPAIPGVTDLALIGGGASATVYQGNEPAMRRKVAVKVLHALIRDARERQAFEQECALAGQVGEHPYAADIYRNGFAGDRPYIVMRYYPRGSMAGGLSPAHPLPVGESITACAHVATALQFAHNRGILHRDVKPENILCDAFGRPVLADFGIATERDASTMTLRHAMTPAYAPPEVLKDGGGWPYSDVWSLAATLYVLLAGQPPFFDPRQGDPRANMRALTGPLPPIRRPDVPGHLQETLARALIGEPDSRTSSARRLAEELNADLQRIGLPPVPTRIDADDDDDARSPVTAVAAGTAHRPGPAQATAPPPGDYPGQQHTVGHLADPALTGYLSTSQSYRIRESERPIRRRVPRPLIATGGTVLLLVVGALAYLLTGAQHRSPPAAAASAGTDATGTTPPPAVTSPSPPTGVSVVVTSRSSVRISWTNTEPASRFRDVVISLGAGNRIRAVPNDGSAPVGGLTPGEPYCFAVGYVYIAGVRPSYSAVTSKACVNGGVPEPAG